MKKIKITQSVDIAMRTLDADARGKVRAWIDHLENIDGDSFVRTHSHSLDDLPGVYVLQTSDGTRIFYRIEGDVITVLDIARKETILTSGYNPKAS